MNFYKMTINNIYKFYKNSSIANHFKMSILCNCHIYMTILLKNCILNKLNVEKYVTNININLTLTIRSLSIFAANQFIQ